MQVIPLNNDGDRTVRLSLGQDIGAYSFRSYYMPVPLTWYFDILSDAGATLVQGLAIVPGVNLLAGHPDLVGIGQLRAADLGVSDPVNALGTELFLVHFAPGEFV